MPEPVIEELRLAKELLESPGLAARISDALGTPVEKGMRLLPGKWNAAVVDITRKSIESALEIALWSLERNRIRAPATQWHKLAVGATGAAGGAFGLVALAIELPVSTTIMLRSIAAIARDEGEDLSAPEARVQCVQVLALGGRSHEDDAAETGYFAARAAMARAVSDAVRHVAERGIGHSGAPAIVRLISAVASRFSVNVTEKAAAQAVP
ncbi:MAG TPA: EcsC family protein, partial [Woeseiaceae bacterium]|nr:EcsC family protein [Woeseiaceae bacterium]